MKFNTHHICKYFFIFFFVTVFFSCAKEDKVFVIVPSSETGINFNNKLSNKPLLNILYYLYFYNGSGVGVGDINNDGLPDIYLAANSKGNNNLYLNKGSFQFEDITDKAGVKGEADWCTGVTMADVNNDGFLDIYVSAVSGKYGLTGHNELFINNGNNTFSEKSKEYGLDFSGFTTQTAFFDYDKDGDLDCYILNQSHHPHANVRDTSFRHSFDSLSGDRFLRNDVKTTGKFTDVSKEAGIYQSNLGYGLGIAISDFNNDGWDDIYIGNDFHENDYYYLNQGNGTFKEDGSNHFRHYSRFSMGNDAADFNNDGQVDVITLDMLPPDEKTLKTYGSDENPGVYMMKLSANGYQNQYSRNCLQMNNGNGVSFSDIALQAGVSATDWSWAPLFADFDNDGKKDLMVTSGIVKRPVDLDYIKFISALKNKGMDMTNKYDDAALDSMPDGASHPFFFKNKDGLNFIDVSNEWGTGKLKGYYNGAAYADFDNDGRLDLVVNCINREALVLKNTSPNKNHISMSFKTDSSNRFGVGVKAWLFTKQGMQFQQLMPARGFMSSVEYKLHFGMDTLQIADSLLIAWPDNHYQILRNVKVNQHLTINYSRSVPGFIYTQFFPEKIKQFTDITDSINLRWSHHENFFIDFNLQYLIPHLESTRGPKIAVADVNNDGLDDFYVCGAKGQPGALMIQNKKGSFVNSDTALFAINTVSEDVDAKFFDANNDGFLDLWVVSGGNEYPQNSLALEDRLYLNDGKGKFTKAVNPFVQQYENKTCIATADIDKDGDIDAFIGNLGNVLAYGLLRPSYLYLNDGKGVFSIDHSKANFDSIGMVTSAFFADVNNDTWPDLVVSGEWMPIKIYINNKGTFKESSVIESTGLWQTLYPTDVNGDGFTDILAGNWGHNSKLWVGKNGPLKLYVKDFDLNGSTEQIMCYTINGKEYTFLAKDELERALPVLKKEYLNYREVAGETVQYMFYNLFTGYKEYKAEVLSSSCFINDGKGNFKRYDLSDDLQFAPVMAFDTIGNNSFMAAGNFYGVVPYEGRYDALLPTTFSFNTGSDKFITSAKIPTFNGEARDIKWLNSINGKKILMITTNNGEIKFYQRNY